VTRKDALAERFCRNSEDKCWPWIGSVDPDGYGLFTHGGRMYRAHRLVYELEVGEIPAGLQLDHLCRVPGCVNPNHLEPVTAAENTRRSPIHFGSQTHCKNGHEFDEENTYLRPTGGRACKTCRRAASRRYEAKR
jgi:hypothetical protein